MEYDTIRLALVFVPSVQNWPACVCDIDILASFFFFPFFSFLFCVCYLKQKLGCVGWVLYGTLRVEDVVNTEYNMKHSTNGVLQRDRQIGKLNPISR